MADDHAGHDHDEVERATATVWVRRHPNGHDGATYYIDAIDGLHWSTVTGGVRAPTSQPYLFGYVSCTDMIDGELAHSGQHRDCPHSVKVCITKTGNDRKVYEHLATLAGEKPRRLPRATRGRS